MIKHLFILTLLIGCSPSIIYSQRIAIHNTEEYCVNSIKLFQGNKMLISVKTNPKTLAPNNELWLTEKLNDTTLTVLSKMLTNDSSKIFWSHHITFFNTPDTIVVFGATIDTKDTTAGLVALLLDKNLNVITEKEVKLNLPFKYPSLKQLSIPFKIEQTSSGEFIGTLTIKNSKPDNIYDYKAPVLQVLFRFDVNQNIKFINQIVSDSINLGQYFILNYFDVLNLLEKSDGSYLLAGEAGLHFNLDSTFNLISFRTTQVSDNMLVPDGQTSFKRTANGYISAALYTNDQSNFTNMPVTGLGLLYNMLKIKTVTNNEVSQVKPLMRLPNPHDSAFINIIKNGEIIFNNNLSLSNFYIESFSVNKKQELVFGYHILSGTSVTSHDGEFNLIFLDSTYSIKRFKTFYEPYKTELTSLTLEDNGDIWVCGYQTTGITPDGKWNRVPYLRLVKPNELTTGIPKHYIGENETFTIYPNPTNDIVNFSQFPSNGLVRIFKNSGELLKEVTLNTTDNKQINVGDLEAGIYFVEVVSTSKESWWSKIVVFK